MPITAEQGTNSADAISLNVALTYLNSSPTASYALSNNYQVSINHSNTDMVTGTSRTLLWDPGSAMQVVDSNGVLGVQSPAMGLIHELAHALFGSDEAQATAFETAIAKELGEPTRANYDSAGAFVHVDNPTQHTDNGQWVERDVMGTVIKGPMYDGSTTAPSMGWAGSVGGGSGGTGGGGGGGGSGGGTDIIGVGDDFGDDDGTVPCPNCHWQNPEVAPAPSLDGFDALLVGVPPTSHT